MTLLCSFITFRSCRHLDGKHSIFGRVVGGLDTLTSMERVETDNKDRPIEDIIVEKAQVFVDPYQEADEQVQFCCLLYEVYLIYTVFKELAVHLPPGCLGVILTCFNFQY